MDQFIGKVPLDQDPSKARRDDHTGKQVWSIWLEDCGAAPFELLAIRNGSLSVSQVAEELPMRLNYHLSTGWLERNWDKISAQITAIMTQYSLKEATGQQDRSSSVQFTVPASSIGIPARAFKHALEKGAEVVTIETGDSFNLKVQGEWIRISNLLGQSLGRMAEWCLIEGSHGETQVFEYRGRGSVWLPAESINQLDATDEVVFRHSMSEDLPLEL